MGWNEGFRAMEQAVIAVYDAGALTSEVLDKIMEPYKETDCDSGGGENLTTKDGLNISMVICKVMEPKKYDIIVDSIINKKGSFDSTDFDNSDDLLNLLDSIWFGKWKMF